MACEELTCHWNKTVNSHIYITLPDCISIAVATPPLLHVL